MQSMERMRIVTQARSWIGTRFLHQGRIAATASDPGGVDCIGLIVGVARQLGIPVQDDTRYSPEPDGRLLGFKLAEQLAEIAPDTMQPGDIALFRMFKHPQHVGIIGDYPLGGLSLIHAYQRSGCVVEHRLDDAWLKRRVSVYQFPQ